MKATPSLQALIHPRRRRSGGFTMIELMITLVVIAILSSVALPSYWNYMVRAKSSELILAASSCRTAVTEVYLSGPEVVAANSWGCESTASPSRYVRSVETDADGRITVIAQNLGSGVDGNAVTLIPVDAAGQPMRYAPGAHIQGWVCGALGTTIPHKYLPASCHGTPMIDQRQATQMNG